MTSVHFPAPPVLQNAAKNERSEESSTPKHRLAWHPRHSVIQNAAKNERSEESPTPEHRFALHGVKSQLANTEASP